jgi:hypothetical protein
VEKSLAADPNYRPGDLISQRQVSAVLSDLKAAGWEPAQSKEISQRTLADNDVLVRKLRTPKGVALMRRVATIAEGYDRLDRLCRMPGGEQIVERLISGPDGYKLVAYLAESRGGQQLGGMLGRAAQDESFNQPTGRIYTAKQLTGALEKAAAESK